MFDIGLYPAGSLSELHATNLTGSDRIRLSLSLDDVRGCEGISWSAGAWSSKGVECVFPGNLSVGASQTPGTIYLNSAHTGSLAAVMGDFSCPNDCSTHGECDGSTGYCTCNAGWWDADCSLSAHCPFGTYTSNVTKPSPCTDTTYCPWMDPGFVVTNASTSACRETAIAPYCEQSGWATTQGCAAYKLACPQQCSGRGACNYTLGACDCNAGYGDFDCACPGNCNSNVGNGVCSYTVPTNGTCSCTFGWSGADCSVVEDVSPSNLLSFEITAAPSQICQSDNFTATVRDSPLYNALYV